MKGNHLGNEAGRALAEALKTNKTLKKFDLADNNFTDEVKDMLRQIAKAVEV
eukprot:m.222780 g.222780  ORF g.222780 m.222780 type:complete len:52 (-) comp77026_c0_seq1:254-409(-)